MTRDELNEIIADAIRTVESMSDKDFMLAINSGLLDRRSLAQRPHLIERNENRS